MNPDYEAKYHALENRHWWFRARRDAVLSLVMQLCPERSTRILEIGCSSGVLIRRLQADGYSSVLGIDISENAIAACRSRGTLNAQVMDAQRLDFPKAGFDLITASDVLEHLGDDAEALREWHRVLKPNGVLIVFVPAFKSLWSAHDEANHHFRRYGLDELKNKVKTAGFAIERASYWNVCLFFPIAVIRAFNRLLKGNEKGVPDNDLFPPMAPLNWSLFAILSGENALFLRGWNFSFGVSAMLVARKPVDGGCA